MDKAAFGKRLGRVRKEKGLSSEALSELCDVNAVFIRQVESAAKLPSLPNFVLICNKLKVSPNLLLADSLEIDTEKPLDDLLKKLRSLTPKQMEIVSAMIDTLVEKMDE